MSIQIDKQELIHWINELEDPILIKNLKTFKENRENKAVEWDELSEAEKEGIKRGLEDIKAGRVRSHEEVKETYEKWL